MFGYCYKFKSTIEYNIVYNISTIFYNKKCRIQNVLLKYKINISFCGKNCLHYNLLLKIEDN